MNKQSLEHDLRNVFTVINSLCDFHLLDLDDGVCDLLALKEDLGRIKESVMSATALCTESSDMEDMSCVLAKLMITLKVIVKASITFKFDPGLPAKDFTMVNRAYFEAVLTNVIKNANEAMPNGGTLTIRSGVTTDPTIAGMGGVVGLYTTVMITDTGPGMSSAALARIMERKFLPKTDGHGYGIENVHHYIRLMRGHVSFESVEGDGTSITLFLPRGSMSSSVLFVDDDRLVRLTACRALRRVGFEVYEAGDGVEALAVLEAHPNVDVLVTDMMMPGMTGLELVAQINRPLPVLFVSGNVTLQHHFARDQYFLTKPYDIATLVRKVEDILRVHYEGVAAVEGIEGRLVAVGS